MAPKRKLLETALSPLPMPSCEAAAASPQGETEGTPLALLESVCLSREMVQVPVIVQEPLSFSSSPQLLVSSGELVVVSEKQRAKSKVTRPERIKGLAQWMRVETLVRPTPLVHHSDALSDTYFLVLKRCARPQRCAR